MNQVEVLREKLRERKSKIGFLYRRQHRMAQELSDLEDELSEKNDIIEQLEAHIKSLKIANNRPKQEGTTKKHENQNNYPSPPYTSSDDSKHETTYRKDGNLDRRYVKNRRDLVDENGVRRKMDEHVDWRCHENRKHLVDPDGVHRNVGEPDMRYVKNKQNFGKKKTN